MEGEGWIAEKGTDALQSSSSRNERSAHIRGSPPIFKRQISPSILNMRASSLCSSESGGFDEASGAAFDSTTGGLAKVLPGRVWRGVSVMAAA